MRIKQSILISFGIALVLMTMWTASAAEIYVPSEPGPTIQGAVNNATDGDTITVSSGFYSENVNVSQANITIRSELGPAVTIVQAASSTDHVFNVTANNVTISGFNVTGATSANGIYLDDVDECIVTNNILSNNDYGIHLVGSEDNTLTSNTATDNTQSGIYLGWGFLVGSSSNNILTDNTASNNNVGLFLTGSYNNLTSNTATDNTQVGIRLVSKIGPGPGGYSSNNILTDNTASNNTGKGIDLFGSYDNILTSNTASNNTGDGIMLTLSSNNILTDNTASDNDIGIHLTFATFGPFGGPSSNNILADNTASNNTGDGIRLVGSDDNMLTSNTASNNTGNGIDLVGSEDNTLTSNTATDNTQSGIYLGWGFLVGSSSNNILTDNTASNNNVGLFLTGSYNNLTSNTATDNTQVGIRLVSKIGPGPGGYSSNNILTDNTASNNTGKGIDLFGSYDNILTSNTASNNTGDGIMLTLSSNNILTDNTASDNDIGIHLTFATFGPFGGPSSNNILADNTASDNDIGIHLNQSNENMLTSNTVVNSGDYGIWMYNSSNSIIYNNYFDNADNVEIDASSTDNIWNSTREMEYYYSGKMYESYIGNFYADYTGDDLDGNGIGDIPYVFTYGMDNYPLMTYPLVTQANIDIENLRDYVNGLEGVDDTTKEDLDGKLKNALHHLAKGNSEKTIEKLEKVIAFVKNPLLKQGMITEEQGEYITSEVERIIEQIQNSEG